MASALIAIARHFDMLTVAEFVEKKSDAEFLVKLGVDCLQGYHFGAATTRPFWNKSAEEKQAV